MVRAVVLSRTGIQYCTVRIQYVYVYTVYIQYTVQCNCSCDARSEEEKRRVAFNQSRGWAFNHTLAAKTFEGWAMCR